MLNKNTGHTASQASLKQMCKNCTFVQTTIFPDLIRCKCDKSSVTRRADGFCILFKEKEER